MEQATALQVGRKKKPNAANSAWTQAEKVRHSGVGKTAHISSRYNAVYILSYLLNSDLSLFLQKKKLWSYWVFTLFSFVWFFRSWQFNYLLHISPDHPDMNWPVLSGKSEKKKNSSYILYIIIIIIPFNLALVAVK